MSRKFANAAKDALNRDYGYEKTYKATFCAAKEYADGGRRRQKVQRCHK